MQRFCTLFDRNQWGAEELDQLAADGLVWTKALNPELLKKKSPEQTVLHYPDLTRQLSALSFRP